MILIIKKHENNCFSILNPLFSEPTDTHTHTHTHTHTQTEILDSEFMSE